MERTYLGFIKATRGYIIQFSFVNHIDTFVNTYASHINIVKSNVYFNVLVKFISPKLHT
jgi:hypothetical protein